MSTDSLRQYLDSLPKHPPLTKAEEAALSRRIRRARKAKDTAEVEAATHEMMVRNLGLVVHIARRYERNGRELMDLIQDGNLGLMKAIENFDHTLDYRFSSYAEWWIRRGIQHGTLADRTIPLPAHIVERINAINRVSRGLVQELGREPESAEIATKMKLKPEEVEAALGALTEMLSINAPVEDGDGVELGDTLASNEASALDTLEEQYAASALDELLGGLTPREEFVVRAKFGFLGDEPMVSRQVTRELGVNDDRVREIGRRALAKLKERAGDGLGGLMEDAA